jgi:hypothetical protein
MTSNQYDVIEEIGEVDIRHDLKVTMRILRGRPNVGPRFDVRAFFWRRDPQAPGGGLYVPSMKGVTFGAEDMPALLDAVHAAARFFEGAPGTACKPAETPSPAPVNARGEVSDAELLAMDLAGLKGKDIAVATGLSGPTISRRLKKLRATAPEISREISRGAQCNAHEIADEGATHDLLV